jgi:hypothetical protein
MANANHKAHASQHVTFVRRFFHLFVEIEAAICRPVMIGGFVMTDPTASTDCGPHAIEANPLEFECNIFNADICTTANRAGLAFIIDDLEDATKIIAGLGVICKLARNNQELASGASEGEDPPLLLTTMESLFHLGEVVARRFLSAMQ